VLFEFSVARKYLIPKKKQLSMSLIALMSIGVISLVVWLILVFLSVTDGIEKNWLQKLTSLNAPIQITPTDAYYESYYYQVDSISHESDFSHKSIREKAISALTDPYQPHQDPEIPLYWPEKESNEEGEAKDLVKLAFASIHNLGNDLIAQDYEVSGALLKLRMVRPQGSFFASKRSHLQSYLSQISYISSFPEKNPRLQSLIESPRIEDLNHLFYLTELSSTPITSDQVEPVSKGDQKKFQKRLEPLLKHIKIQKVKTRTQNISFLLPLLKENTPLHVQAYQKGNHLSYFILDNRQSPHSPFFEEGTLHREKDRLIYRSLEGKITEVGLMSSLFSKEPLSMEAKLETPHLDQLMSLSDLKIHVKLKLQKHLIEGTIPWENIEIEEADCQVAFEQEPEIPPPWAYTVQSLPVLPKSSSRIATAIFPRSFQTSGVRIGDTGYFSYTAATTSSAQEQRLPIEVGGFYDPGIMGMGTRMILTDERLVHTINSSSQTASFDQNMMNGIQIWYKDLGKTAEVKKKLTEAFAKAEILPYWKITPYYDYDFAKDLLQQFQSDKYLFTLIGLIVLLVACTNIISLLVILVNDKKKEIAILSAMGAPKKSIAIIFTLCGGVVGCFSTLIGTIAALLTLHYIDGVVQFLSFLQGHEAFNSLFYGKSLPSQLSERALTFILIATPIVSFAAGLVPALKACRLHPSKILRSE
jgi:lipoprotein-releasing system permease protein